MPQFVLSLFVMVVVLPLSLLVTAAQSEPLPLNLYTEHSPPGEYLNAQGEVAGVTVDLIRLLLQRLDQPATIELLPWARALELAKTQPNSGLFETVRNPEREALFKWVGPLKMHSIGLYGLSDFFPGGNFSPGINSRHLACVYRESVHVKYLQRMGFNDGRNLILTVNHGDCFKLLRRGRVHLVVLNEAAFSELQLEMQQSDQQLVMLQQLTEVQLYLAFSRDIDDSTIARWQRVLEDSYLDGSMRRLYQGLYPEQMIARLEQFASAKQKQLQQNRLQQ
ncbi:substrate-binding periplasmic protein [Arsukibacterium perlucidum]|uniref:substrate-binding periplasmic protein n=1 Tax=Arsukibacterium perlucidum TaxID=368811 RepID=UPI00036DC759|nr:transporter substrate-binding domain-containing protein [Arsukibacterium perlucidum]